MKRSLKHITVVYLLLATIFATSGVQVFSSYCYCKNSLHISIIYSGNHCHNQQEESSQQPIAFKGPKCCNEANTYIKFTNEYIPGAQLDITINPIYFSDFERNTDNKQFTQIASNQFLFNRETVPLRHGKDLIYAIHSIKIPDC